MRSRSFGWAHPRIPLAHGFLAPWKRACLEWGDSLVQSRGSSNEVTLEPKTQMKHGRKARGSQDQGLPGRDLGVGFRCLRVSVFSVPNVSNCIKT